MTSNRRLPRVRRALQVAQREHDQRLLEVAGRRALLTKEQLEALIDEDEPLPAAMRRGWLRAEDLGQLEEAVARADFARPALDEIPLPAEVSASAPTLDEFVLVERLGGGGAGEVWRAWDRVLGRWVAIKRPHASVESHDDLERLRREAQAAARLQHPHIVSIHKVGQIDGRPYLVMPLIRGRTLAELRMSRDEALQAVRAAALALDHAHGHGLVHRDVKPSNLMRDEEGRVWVLDFGLAHARELAGRVTRPGVALGTAAYMSPEQAEGSPASRERTTDVYGLGATLYHLVTGVPPFAGDSFSEIVAQVLSREPVPAHRRAPGLERDLETVIGTAMAKDPARRYQTAAALADDLGRLLAGEPIRARRLGPVERARRHVRKHSRAWAVVAILICVSAGALSWARMRLVAARAEALETVRRMARLSLETALRLRRAGDHAGMRQVLPELEAAYQRARSRAPELAEVDYLMGRMHRALMDEPRALAFQEAALAKQPAFAPALYERVVLRARAHDRGLRREMGLIRPGDGPGVNAPSGRPVRAGARAAAEARRPELRALGDELARDAARLTPTALGEAAGLALRGTLAYHAGDYAQARPLLEAALAREPLMEEAWEALAYTVEATGPLTAAQAVYTRALSHDRGYVPLLVGRCRVHTDLGQSEAAIADADAALKAMPDLVAAQICRARARMHAGHLRMLRGEDPSSLFDQAEAEFRVALARDGAQWGANWGLGTLARYRAHHLMRVGADPLPVLAESEAQLGRALAVERENVTLWSGRGRTRALRAYARAERGEDAAADFAAAEADLGEALRRENETRAWEWLGDLRAHRGRATYDRGGDPEADFAAAEEAFARILSRPSGPAWAHFMRARLRRWRGEAAARAGRDPLPSWAAAEEDLGKAMAREPLIPDFPLERVRLRLARAKERRRPAAARAADVAAARAEMAELRARYPSLREP